MNGQILPPKIAHTSILFPQGYVGHLSTPMQADWAAIENIYQLEEKLHASRKIHIDTKAPHALQPSIGVMLSQEYDVPRMHTIRYPPQMQLMQKQATLQECIMSLQHVYVQRHAIYIALSQEKDLVAQMPQLDGSKIEIRGKQALEEAFAQSTTQLQSTIANLQTRLLLSEGNSAQQQTMPQIPSAR